MLTRFAKAVRSIAPDATGAPISIQEAGATIVQAFEIAGALALVAIVILLFVALRSARDVFNTMVPVLFVALLTLGTSVAIGLPINFANIIALPLMFGVGVAFHIYFVIAWRQGETDLLQSPLTPRRLFQRAHHRRGVRQPLALQTPRHSQHGRASDDLAGLDPGGGAFVRARAPGSSEKPVCAARGRRLRTGCA